MCNYRNMPADIHAPMWPCNWWALCRKPPGPFAFTDGGSRDRSGPYRTFVMGTLAAWANHRKLLGGFRETASYPLIEKKDRS